MLDLLERFNSPNYIKEPLAGVKQLGSDCAKRRRHSQPSGYPRQARYVFVVEPHEFGHHLCLISLGGRPRRHSSLLNRHLFRYLARVVDGYQLQRAEADGYVQSERHEMLEVGSVTDDFIKVAPRLGKDRNQP